MIASPRFLSSFIAAALLFLAGGWQVLAVDFLKDVQPIFAQKCYKCHSKKENVRKAGYVFDDPNSVAKFVGPSEIIVPGDAGSDLIRIVSLPPGSKDAMPPQGKGDPFTPAEVKLLRDWIKEGATLPGKPAPTVAANGGKPAPAKSMTTGGMAAWTNTEGKTIQAEFVKFDGTNVILRMAGGKFYNYPMGKLNAASQEQARKLAPKQ